MAKAKKSVETIVGPGKDPEMKLTVQKSIPLFSLWRSDMSLAEFKILDTYLSRINSHEPEKRTVVFTKGELEQLLGVTKINKNDLVLRLKGLGRLVDIQKEDDKIHQIGLFEEVVGEIDETGLWAVQLTCTASAMKYIFNVEALGYLRYKLRCITSLTSRYTYVLFMYLESNRFRKCWTVDVDELRQILNCDQDESYSAFKVFNDRILKRCQKELLEKTECRFSYEPIKTGRKVTSVRFVLETFSDTLADHIPGQLTIDNYENEAQAVAYECQRRSDICCGFEDPIFAEFSEEELREFRSIAWKKASPDTEEYHYNVVGDRMLARQLAVAEFIQSKIQAMNVYAKREPIKNRYSYLKKALSGKDED